MTRGRSVGAAALLAGGVLVVDQASKALVRARIPRGGSEELFLGIELVNTRNRGIAFGLFPGGGLLLAVAATAMLLSVLAYLVRHADRPYAWLAIGLIAGGAAGNLIDRVRDGAVTDFIDFPFWPTFNVADIAITLGVISLLWVLEGPRARDG